MELTGTYNETERTQAERRRTAEEIHATINHSLSQLLDHKGLPESHSSVVGLRIHQKIALRALRQFEGADSLIQAA